MSSRVRGPSCSVFLTLHESALACVIPGKRWGGFQWGTQAIRFRMPRLDLCDGVALFSVDAVAYTGVQNVAGTTAKNPGYRWVPRLARGLHGPPFPTPTEADRASVLLNYLEYDWAKEQIDPTTD